MQVNRHALRIIRQRSGLGLGELARRAGCSQPHLSNIEHGRRQPSPATLRRLAEALQVPLLALLAEPEADGGTGQGGPAGGSGAGEGAGDGADGSVDGVARGPGGGGPDGGGAQRALSRKRSTSTITRVTRPTATRPRSSSTDTVKVTRRPATRSTVAVAVTV